MSSSSQGRTVFDAVRTAAAENEKVRRVDATHAAVGAWGGVEALKHMISAAVNHWQTNACCFRHGTKYETAYLDYASRMPPTLNIEPALNTAQDRLHLTLPALPIRVVLALDSEGRLQWAIAQRDINDPANIRDIAGPAFLKAQQAAPKNGSCAYAYNGHRQPIIKDGITVRLSSGTGRKDIQVCLRQHDAEGYQRAGLTHLSAVAPRKVVFDLTIKDLALNPRPTLYFRLIFDLDYGQPGHAGAVPAHEVVARSLGVRAPRVLRRW